MVHSKFFFFGYGEYHVNIDGMFAIKGFNEEVWGYGTTTNAPVKELKKLVESFE